MEAVRRQVDAVEKTQRLTAKTDPNDLLGRPNGYTAATVFYDRRVEFPCAGPGVDCGATLEVWPEPQDARERADYIESIGAPLANEYDYVRGRLLLRVTGELIPLGDEYRHAKPASMLKISDSPLSGPPT